MSSPVDGGADGERRPITDAAGAEERRADARIVDAAGDPPPALSPPERPATDQRVLSPEGVIPPLPPPSTEAPVALVAGYGARRVTSRDGHSWGFDVQSVAKGYDDWDNIRGTATGAGHVVAVGGGPRREADGSFGRQYWRVLVTADGERWADMRGPGGWFGAIAYGHGLWVVIGGVGLWAHSRDLVHWIQNPGPGPAYRSMAFGNGVFVAVGGGARNVSRDGKTWSHRGTGDSRAITFGGGKFVAVGGDGCAVSVDGVSWRERACTGDMRWIAYGAGRFVAVNYDQVQVSADGERWTVHPGQNLSRVGFARGVFIGVAGRVVKTSVDGTTWTVRYDVPSENGFSAVLTVPSP